jgi:hypothetical protein
MKSEYQRLGENCEYQIEGDNLTIRVNLKADGARSASGKSIVIASTRGAANVNGVNIGLNVYRKA